MPIFSKRRRKSNRINQLILFSLLYFNLINININIYSLRMDQIVKIRDFTSEFKFSSSRSSGPGGQNVNKVNSRIELRFNIIKSELLNEDEKVIILRKLKTKINSDGDLIITAQEDRSQLKNKQEAIGKFYDMIIKALTPVKKRRATNPTKSSVEKRLKKKKEGSEIKQMRKKIKEI